MRSKTDSRNMQSEEISATSGKNMQRLCTWLLRGVGHRCHGCTRLREIKYIGASDHAGKVICNEMCTSISYTWHNIHHISSARGQNSQKPGVESDSGRVRLGKFGRKSSRKSFLLTALNNLDLWIDTDLQSNHLQQNFNRSQTAG